MSNNNRDKENCCFRDSVPVVIGYATRILKASIPVGNGKTVELIGRSWAADSTAFAVPALDIALDAGYPVQSKTMSSVFVTHIHADHCHFLTHMKSRSKPPTFFLPEESVPHAQRYLDAAQQLSSHLTPSEYELFDWEPDYFFRGSSAGDRIVVNKKRGLICRVINCDHGLPCIGYCFSQVKNALKPEYKGLSGAAIGKLRKEGVVVTAEEEHPMFCLLGDTTVSILESGPEADRIFACPTVIIECTFLTDDYRDNATKTKHILWPDLKPHVVAHPETTFVLTHFSHRWTTKKIASFFAEQNLPNVVPWIPSDKGLYCKKVGSEAEIEEVYNHS